MNKGALRGLGMLLVVFLPYAALVLLNIQSSSTTSGEESRAGRISIVAPAHEILSTDTFEFSAKVSQKGMPVHLGINFHNPSDEKKSTFLEIRCEGQEDLVLESFVPRDNSVLFFKGYATAYFELPEFALGEICGYQVDPGASGGVWLQENPPAKGSLLLTHDLGDILPNLVVIGEGRQ
jgi:hypothetical protein